MKQYGIDPRLVIWIQRNTGHDLQTFSDLAKIKYLDSRKRNYSAAKKIDNIRIPSWLVVKDGDFSLIGEMAKLKQLCLHDVAIDDYSFLTGCRELSTLDLQDTNFSDCRILAELSTLKKVVLPAYSQLQHTEVLEQLSCCKEIKEEKMEEPQEAEPFCMETKCPTGQQASCGALHLGNTAHLSIDGMGIVLFSAEVMESVAPGSNFQTEEFTNPEQVGAHIRKGDITAFCTGTQETGIQVADRTDYLEMIRQLYAVEELQGYTEEEIAIVKKYFGSIPRTVEEFWRSALRTEAIHGVQDQWIKPEDFDKWDWLRDNDYLIILNENQGCCRAGIRRRDLTKADPPVYVTSDDRKWTLCAVTVSGFLQAALAYEAVFAFPFQGEELVYWLTEDELETVQSNLEKKPFGLQGWLETDMSFYSNAPDNMVVIMDSGDLEVLYGAASETGYEKLMEVMEGIGEAL